MALSGAVVRRRWSDLERGVQPMRSSVLLSLLLGGVAMASCSAGASDPADPGGTAPAAGASTAAWPASLRLVGDGFPQAGAPCRVIGETAATADFLDDQATLAGCLDPADAAKLGGRVVATVDGVTLVSVPHDRPRPGDGDSQGDALVAGTKYNATAALRCSGYRGAGPGLCPAGVVRGTETGTYIEVTLPDGRQRVIFFDQDGRFLSFSTAEADGTAAMKIDARREGDTTIATLGTERYEIPDAFLTGG